MHRLEFGYTINMLVRTLVDITSRKDMEQFLIGILTARELIEISNRLEIVRLLKEGYPQHVVAYKLKVGIATVSRGAKELQKGHFSNI